MDFKNVVIVLEKNPHDLKMEYIKINLSKDMPLEQIAKLLVENIKHKDGVKDLEPIRSGAAQINGKPGYQFFVTYKTASGIRMKRMNYILRENDSLYFLAYVAPKRYYFDKYLGIFEKVVANFQLGKSAAIINYKPALSKGGDDY